MANGNDLEGLRKALRAKCKSDQDVTLAAADLRLLLDEVGRLQQSNDRLRRQNRRVRLKLQRAGLADGDAPNDDGPNDDGPDPDGGARP